ncbi:hypothetical protein BCV69DRAFT_297995 [Microstroma glucosiphilum]|uniref:Uncharacterized protein n=1 Tax=Pseudomicrostroma glucosiphilum TaxID=1684307 RepID=A0A316U991_9BASI|nr:hypothetical protein BCV69DRAFT_297995 [Pseudomicrostroma glucosiphilum]PWN21786.1 hypothetical protein BCV69DRAFT_297995 [Pseudomicrostroma glucosiphilum]
MLKQLALLAIVGFASLSSVKAEFDTPHNLPAKSDGKNGQTGYNDCRKRYGDSHAKAHCQNIYVNSVQDFCIYGPAKPSKVSDVEASVVSYCTKEGYGTRTIPPGTITGASFLKTPHYVQLSLVGDFTKINVAPKDEGGELDAHGATNTQNPVGALVYSRAWTGEHVRAHEWHQFLGYNEASVRACNPGKDKQHEYCPNQYDEMGAYITSSKVSAASIVNDTDLHASLLPYFRLPHTGSQWNDPGQYEAGKFENCQAEDGLIPGVYHGKQWHQGEKPVPKAHPAPRKFNCKNFKGLNGGKARLIPDSRRRSMAFSNDLEADELALERDMDAEQRAADDEPDCDDSEDCAE